MANYDELKEKWERGVIKISKNYGTGKFGVPNPGVSFTWVINLIINALGSILPVLTPMIREALTAFLNDLYKKAVETPNPWDDFVVKFLMRILGIPIPE